MGVTGWGEDHLRGKVAFSSDLVTGTWHSTVGLTSVCKENRSCGKPVWTRGGPVHFLKRQIYGTGPESGCRWLWKQTNVLFHSVQVAGCNIYASSFCRKHLKAPEGGGEGCLKYRMQSRCHVWRISPNCGNRALWLQNTSCETLPGEPAGPESPKEILAMNPIFTFPGSPELISKLPGCS